VGHEWATSRSLPSDRTATVPPGVRLRPRPAWPPSGQPHCPLARVAFDQWSVPTYLSVSSDADQPMADHTRLVGYVLTRNEENNIERSVRSLAAVCQHVVVVDSESTDATVEIAREQGADVVVHPFKGFSAQRNSALDHIGATYDPDYILTIDADEWLDDVLLADLWDRIERNALTADVYLLHREIRYDGRALRWGGFGSTWLPRLFRPTSGRYEARVVNEHLALVPWATTARLAGRLVNADVTSWEDHIAKHNRYSTLEAGARVQLRRGEAQPTTLREAVARPYMRRRWLRQQVWDRLPARPALRFVQIYLVAGGFIDGRAGFHRAMFEAWQEMCIDLKAKELEPSGPTGTER
jgi:hypothetical protein